MSEQPERIGIETASLNVEVQLALESILPGVFADGVVDAQRIAEAVGLPVAGTKLGKERFGAMWAGKSDALKALQAPSLASLKPDLDTSVNFDQSSNVLIHGDNLEVLKLLQKAYNDKIKLIYIDPPYNTGKDFVYSDDYRDSVSHYLTVTGQLDDSGNRLTANVETSGRKHSKWMNMMFPRLVLARNLLAENGAIFCSIDEREVHHLRMLMDEIFGPENFVAEIVWQARPSVQNDTDISTSHEYIVCYARNRRQEQRRLKSSNAAEWHLAPSFAIQPKDTDELRYSKDDEDGRGPYKEDPFDAPNIRPNLTYPIPNPNTGEIFMPPKGRCWRTMKSEFDRLNSENRISWGTQGSGKPKLKSYLRENMAFGEVPSTWLTSEMVGSATLGTREIQDLFDGQVVFDTAKPTKLIRHLMKLAMPQSGIILDFFAGSGSTGHAVFLENAEDLGTRQFILINSTEETTENSVARKAGFASVSQITEERILRSIKKVSGAEESGVRIFRLAESPFVSSNGLDESGVPILTPKTVSESAAIEAIATDALLKSGVMLSADWNRFEIDGCSIICAERTCIIVSSELSGEVVAKIIAIDCDVFIFLEDAFLGRDAIKANAYFACKKANKTMRTI